MNRTVLGWLAVTAGGLSAWGQPGERRATPTGSRGDRGKCTIEVDVDSVAEVEIFGDSARLVTIGGSPAVWRRFECSDALPRNPADFSFSGIDGRGRQILVRDPRNNRGVAVVRIEDPKGGREGYTFDIEWRDFASGGGGGGGFGRYDGGDRRRDDSSYRSTDRAISICRDAVRERAEREYGYRDLDFGRIGLDDNPGRRDWITGTFRGHRGYLREDFEFACAVDFNNGRVRSLEVRRR